MIALLHRSARRWLVVIAGMVCLGIAVLSRLFFTPAMPGTVVINEAMASNGGVIADDDGDFEDWIELYNPHP